MTKVMKVIFKFTLSKWNKNLGELDIYDIYMDFCSIIFAV